MRERRPGGWKRGALLLVTLAVGTGVLLWFRGRTPDVGRLAHSAGRTDGPTQSVQAQSSSVPPWLDEGIGASREQPSPTAQVQQESDEEEIFDPRAAIALTQELIEDYRRRSEFPPESRPIESGQDPILAEREVSPIEAGGPEGGDPVLTVFPGQLVFEEPDSVLVYAYLTAQGEKVPAQSITGILMSEGLQEVGTFDFRDDGRDGDAQAGDAVYTARIEPPAGEEVAVSYLVRVVAVSLDGLERRAGTSFQYSRPGARLTGNFRDYVENGSLVIEVELDVQRGGAFHLSGTLYDSGGRPVGLAQNRKELEAGQHWIPLLYYGRMFHPDERTGRPAATGPFQLRFVSLLNATNMPNAVSRLWEPNYWTRAYSGAEFTAEPFNDPFYLEAIAREEKELERLQALAAQGDKEP